MRTLTTLAPDGLNIEDYVLPNVFSYFIGSALGHEWYQDCMELGLRFSENDILYIFYIIFICLCLLFIVLCISYLILFPLRHIPLPLFHKCIWSHANIWDGASFCNSLQSLAIDCIYRELHLGYLLQFYMCFWLFCFKRSN